MEPVSILIGAGVAAFALTKTGAGARLLARAGIGAGRAAKYLTDEEGAWVSLAERLPYRDFIPEDECVETKDGWLWCGMEIDPVASDGFGGRDWNMAHERLTRLINQLDDGLWIQVVCDITHDTADAKVVADRVCANAHADETLRIWARSRARQIERDARAGLVCTNRTYIFIGKQYPEAARKLSLLKLFSTRTWVDVEYDAYCELRAVLFRGRDFFRTAYRALGGGSSSDSGGSRVLTSDEIYRLIAARLNPERTLAIEELAKTSQTNNGNTQGTMTGTMTNTATGTVATDAIEDDSDWSGFVADLVDESLLDAKDANHADVPLPRDPDARLGYYPGAQLFADNPRESLLYESLQVKEDYLQLGGRPTCIISLQTLPKLAYAGLCETLTRHPEICFPITISTHFQIGDQTKWDEDLERRQNRIEVNLERSRFGNKKEEHQGITISQLRDQINDQSVKLGEGGFQVQFSAANVTELYRRRAIVLHAWREMEAMEGVVEPSLPIPQFVASLPCAPHDDNRRQPFLSRDFAAMAPLTGGGRGCELAEATEVFERPDGGLVRFNAAARRFHAGMFLMCGSTRSGKSGRLNQLRLAKRAAGYRLITMDYGGSSYRICQALGGNYIDITDASKSYKLKLFDIRPKASQVFKPEELTADGLPKRGLAEVENLLEMLALDPRRPQDSLPHRHAAYLRQVVRETYRILVNDTPQLDDFLNTLQQGLREDREIAADLYARLEIYASDSGLGRFLNESADAVELSVECPYTVFDLRGCTDDPRLMMVASLAVNSFIRRVLRTDRRIKKYLDIDEFNVVSKNPIICNMIDETIRTAGKLGMLAGVASQRAEDFRTTEANPAAGSIRDNCGVRWLFRTENPGVVARVFELSPGQAALYKEICLTASDEWRDCLVTYPGGGCSRLRLRMSPFEKRLCLGAAGEEAVSLEAALKDAYASRASASALPARLTAALAADALGVSASGKSGGRGGSTRTGIAAAAIAHPAAIAADGSSPVAYSRKS